MVYVKEISKLAPPLPSVVYTPYAAGSNCLAAPRDFASPVAWYEDVDCHFVVMHKVWTEVWEVAPAQGTLAGLGIAGIIVQVGSNGE